MRRKRTQIIVIFTVTSVSGSSRLLFILLVVSYQRLYTEKIHFLSLICITSKISSTTLLFLTTINFYFKLHLKVIIMKFFNYSGLKKITTFKVLLKCILNPWGYRATIQVGKCSTIWFISSINKKEYATMSIFQYCSKIL